MKRSILLLSVILLSCIWSSAQTLGSVQGQCQKGDLIPTISGLSLTQAVIGSYPSCTVTVYLTGTLTLAPVYSTGSFGTLSNPFTANADGSWLFFANIVAGLDVVTSSGNPFVLPSPFTYTGVFPNGSTTGTGTCCSGLTSAIIPQASSATNLANSNPQLDNGATLSNALSYAGAGGINVRGDGTHPGQIQLAGQTTNPSITSNSVSWAGPPSASFTSYILQLPSIAPSGGQTLSCATPVSSISSCTFVSAGGGVSGSGTANTIPEWNGSTSLGNSPITDDGSGNITLAKALTVTNGVTFTSRFGSYNGYAPPTGFSNGMSQTIAAASGSAFTANISAFNISAPGTLPSSLNLYAIYCYLSETVASSGSSTLPQCQVSWTDNFTGVTETATFSSTNTGNTVGTFTSGFLVINPQPSTNVNVSTTGYASSPSGMTYKDFFLLSRM